LTDPFPGPLAEANLCRFSSKEWHANAGLYYYGYRYYDPNLQRWLNWDPIKERGGLNLYRFVANNAVNSIDPFGLDEKWPPPKPNPDWPHGDPWPQPDPTGTNPTGKFGDSCYKSIPDVFPSLAEKIKDFINEYPIVGLAAGALAKGYQYQKGGKATVSKSFPLLGGECKLECFLQKGKTGSTPDYGGKCSITWKF